MHTLKKRELPSNILRYVLLLLGGAVSVMPMIYMISTSLKPNGALYEFPPKFFPALDTITLENYVYIFSQEKFYINFLNSVIVAVLTVVIAAFVSSALAFCLARFRFPGRKALFALVIGTMIIPGTTLIITQYQLASFFKITNKLLGLVPFYVAWVIPFSTFMIKGYIESIPREFDEAVYMDGGSVFTVFFKVICPLASPAIASVSIFNFLTAWEEFPWALTVLNDTQKRTLPIAISGFFGQHQFTQWGYVFAMSVASLLPVLIIFICCQKYFVSGLQTGGTGTLSSPAVGTIIKYYSRTTSSFGYGSVGRRNVEVKASSGKTIGGLTELKVTYGSCESGDSGGPFFQDASSGAKYCGVLHGNRTDSSGNMYVYFTPYTYISSAGFSVRTS